jgi:ribose 5-phosphate isomerase B
MVANKIRGVRAACCFDEFAARSSREHNNANVLTLGGKVLGVELAKAIVTVWLETSFGGGRHQKRVDKITEIEKRNSQ